MGVGGVGGSWGGIRITNMLNRPSSESTSSAGTTGSGRSRIPVLSQASSSLSLARAFGGKVGTDGHVLSQPPTGNYRG